MRFLIIHPNEAGVLNLIENGLRDAAPVNETSIATSAETAFSNLRRNHYDLIVTAASLPGSSGGDIIDFLRNNKKYGHATTPVIVIDGELALAQDIAGSRHREGAMVLAAENLDLALSTVSVQEKFGRLVERALYEQPIFGAAKSAASPSTVTVFPAPPARPSDYQRTQAAVTEWAKNHSSLTN